MTFVEFLP